MKIVILAGGLGTRLAEETELRPKPMIRIGSHPILWHILKHFTHYGHDEFVLALGYLGEEIKRYFLDYHGLDGSMTLDLSTGTVTPYEKRCERWKLHLMDTGLRTNTGGRIKRLQRLIDSTFMVTYGDGVSNVDIDALVRFHKSQGKLATVTAVRPPARFGGLILDGDTVARFTEKPVAGEGWINGGFFVLEPGIFDYIDGDDSCSFESNTLERIAADGQLAAYRHDGFWQCMDTLRDKWLLEALWKEDRAPWKVWE